MEKISHANGNLKRTEAATLIPDKIDFKSNTLTRDKRRTLYNDKMANTSGRYNNYMCIQEENP